jgi:hypothetical protein
VSDLFCCNHCRKTLITVDPGQLTTHGPLSIRTDVPERQAWVECPKCGRETPLELARLGDFTRPSLA